MITVVSTRRDVLRLALGGAGLIGLSACGVGGDSTTTNPSATNAPLAAPSPIRTPTPDVPVRRIVALSSADLDVLRAVDIDPTAAWAVEGTGPRPWREMPTPPAPEWDGPGMPSLRSLVPFGIDAFALAAADVSESQLRGYERLATVIIDPAGRPGWREHLELVAQVADRDPGPARETTGRELDAWARSQRAAEVDTFVVVIGTGADPDTPVATLAADSPFGAEIRELGFDVRALARPTPYRQLEGSGVRIVRVDPRDSDLVAAVRQPSVTSLPWALGRLVRGSRSG